MSLKTLDVTLVPLFLIFLIDQLTKFFFYSSSNGSLNQGISFSFLSSASQLGQILLIFVMVVFALFVWRQFGRRYSFLTGLILGGAVSNIIDRLFFGGVRDFLPVPFVSIQNNLADWAIFVGLLGILGREWWGSRNVESRK